MRLLNEPLLTNELSPDDLRCAPRSLYLHTHGPEERSLLLPGWVASEE